MAAAGADGDAEVPAGIGHVLEQPLAEDRRRRVADRAVVVQGGLDEAVLRGAFHPVARHRLVDVGREGRILDVVARRDQVLDLVVEEGVVAHAVDVVAERQHAVIGAEGAQPGLPQRREPDLQHQAPQEEQQRVAPVGGIGPVAHRLDVQMGLHHAAEHFEHLVGDVGRLLGKRRCRARARPSVAVVASLRSPGQLDQLGEHAAARRRLDPLHRMALVAADIKAFPGLAGEGRRRAASASRCSPAPLPACRISSPSRRGGRLVLPHDHQPAIGPGQPPLDAGHGLPARDGPRWARAAREQRSSRASSRPASSTR